MHLGDRKTQYPIDFTFTSRYLTGQPYTLAGSPAVACYKNNGTTKIWDGITLTTDFNSITGLNQVRVNPSGQANYPEGNDYSIVLVSGSVSGISVAGETLATFTLKNLNQTPTDPVAVSGNVGGVLAAVAVSGTVAATLSSPVSVSGVSTGAATQIWSATQRSLTDAVTVSGATPFALEQYAASGWAYPVRSLTDKANFTLANSVILEISGAAAYGVWNHSTRSLTQPVAVSGLVAVSGTVNANISQPVTVSGITPAAAEYAAASGWSYGTRTLTSMSPVTVSGLDTISQSQIWSYATRGLTQPVAVSGLVAVSGTVNASLSQPVTVSGVTPAAAGVIAASGWSHSSRQLTTDGNQLVATEVWSADYTASPFVNFGTVGYWITNSNGLIGNIATSVWNTSQKEVTVSGVKPVALEQIANSGWSNPTRTLTAPVATSGNVSVSGTVNTNVVQISGDSTAAYNLATQAKTVLVGEVRASGANSTTAFLTNLSGYSTDLFGDANGGCVIAFVSDAANKFQTRRVSGSTTLGTIILESSLDVIPSGNDRFVILGRIEQ